MKVRVSEATPVQLNWLAAQAEGLASYVEVVESFQPTSDWAQGGPIIERKEIELVPKGMHWEAYADEDFHVPYSGPTPLIAAMRCYVAGKLGDEVEIPNELKGEGKSCA